MKSINTTLSATFAPRHIIIGAMSLIGAIALMGLGACAGGSAAAPTHGEGGGPETIAAQIARGQALYGDNCASCHGNGGEGTEKAPPVVGAAALPLDPPETRKFRKTQFKTALDVAQFVVTSMPPPPNEKLAEADYWAILAFDLHANGVKLDAPVDATAAAAIVLH